MSRKISIEYGDGVLPLPKEGLLEALPSANEFNLKVLLFTASDDSLRRDYDAMCAALRTKLDCTQSALERAFAFWAEKHVITLSGGEFTQAETSAAGEIKPAGTKYGPERAGEPGAAPVIPNVCAARPLPAAPPSYTEGQCADIIAGSGELPDVIDMCQQIIGKIFTSADVEVIVMLFDHLGLSGEYIANLIAYCVGNGKKSLRYIEKTALNLFDEGVDTPDALTAYIKRKENFEDNISAIRKMIGAGSRELTQKEKKAFSCWLEEWRFEPDVIQRAYEITVDKINEPSVSYMNRVLENWHKSGLNTLGAVEASLEAYKKNKAEAANSSQTVNGTESGFRTDEFFEAALKRSYKSGGSDNAAMKES